MGLVQFSTKYRIGCWRNRDIFWTITNNSWLTITHAMYHPLPRYKVFPGLNIQNESNELV